MADAKTVLEFRQAARRQDPRSALHRYSRALAPRFLSHRTTNGSIVRRRLWHGRLFHSRLGGIHESDMLLMPDPNSICSILSPRSPTLVMICDVVDPVTKQRYDRDPRYIARKAEMYLASTGIADTAYFGAEAEFFIFDNVRFDQREQHGFYFIDAEEGRWNSGREENNWDIVRDTKKDISRSLPPTTTRTCAAKWC